MLLSDITTIVERSRSAGFPAAVLLIDEADVLAENHALLQTLRNLLMDSGHFSIIAAGTEKMFPAISDVFSPVPRQFVRINVEPFKEWEDTRRAIRRRLALAGQDWAMPPTDVCREIHSLTQGKPYEVMLVSHFAYRERTREAKQRIPMTITPGVMADVAAQLQQQDPAVQLTLSKLQGLNAKDAHTTRELMELDGVALDTFAVAELDFKGSFSQADFTTARARVSELITRLSSTGFIGIDDGRVSVRVDSFQRALIKYVVLGRREPRDEHIPDLGNPRVVIPQKVRSALAAEIQHSLGLDDDSAIVSEIHFQNDRISRRLAFDSELPLHEFKLQGSCVVGTSDKMMCVLAVRGADLTEESTKALSSAMSTVQGRLAEFSVVISDCEVRAVDLEAVEAIRDVGIDPLEELVTEAQQSFWVGAQDMEAQVAAACQALQEAEASEDETRRNLLNNCAFMALSTKEDEVYRELSDRAEALKEPFVLTIATRALWEACQGNYDAALKRLDFDEDAVAEASEHSDCLMYSPAVLAQAEPFIAYSDLVGEVDLLGIVVSYITAIRARAEERAVATALSEIPEPAPWLLGVAADAAAIEGDPELETRLRRRAAESVGDRTDEDDR
jgi:hypothetical protein